MHAFTPLALRGCEWPVSQARHFVSCKKPLVPLEYKIPRAGLVIFKKEKVSCSCQKSSTKSSSEEPSHYTDCAPYFDGFYLKINIWIFYGICKVWV